jgi:hypothetical protein
MASVIHATIKVSGDDSQLAACDARIHRLLDAEPVEGEIAEHHGSGALCYDLKVRGGIPFPAFVLASREFPGLRIEAEWVNVEENARGAATIVDGRLVEHAVDRLALADRSVRPAFVSAGENGRIELALTFLRHGPREWLGYALTADRDALLKFVRGGGDQVELYATEGGAEWSVCWHGSLARLEFERVALAAPQEIDAELYAELERMAQGFVDEWVWFASGPAAQIAVEKERYARYGYAVSDANLRTARLHRMKSGPARSDGRLVFSSLGADDDWVREVAARCWLGSRER